MALVALVSKRGRAVLVAVRESIVGTELWFAWAVAAVAMAGSLFFSEYASFPPCRLCWFQRIGMYPLTAILLVAALRRDRRTAVQYAIWFPIVGSMVSWYHIYIENNPAAESAACRRGVSCATKWIDKFGYVTIPTLSATAFATIFVLLLFVWSRERALAVGEGPATDDSEA
ncbi:MAG: disulfide bond formation protein B, partial [Thermoleophilia bacterium]|nr:disulfide bond formation protein B [Thermoleophilia bacterium]